MQKPLQMRISPESLLDPAQLRAKQLQEEEQKRFEEIADEIIEILNKKEIIVRELPRVYATINERLNQKMDEATIKKVLEL